MNWYATFLILRQFEIGIVTFAMELGAVFDAGLSTTAFSCFVARMNLFARFTVLFQGESLLARASESGTDFVTFVLATSIIFLITGMDLGACLRIFFQFKAFFA